MSIIIDFINWQWGRADNFGCLLFHMIAKADRFNLAKLEREWPKEVALFKAWQNCKSVPTKEDIIEIGKKLGLEI